MPPKRTTNAEGYQQVFYATAMFVANKTVGDEVYGDCPICGGIDKFYLNTLTAQWSCKAGKPSQIKSHDEAAADREGNLYDWLQSWLNYCNHTYDKSAEWVLLSRERGIPVDALKESGMAWDGSQWLIPAYNERGTVTSLCRYGEDTEGQVRVVSGLKAPLFNLDLLSEYPKNATIYLCEGPWDAMLLQYHLQKNGVALGVPGANTFKRDWIDFFTGHPVVLCYDNDIAGQKGSTKVLSTIVSVSQDLKQIVWPDDVDTGWDVRDHFKAGGTLVELLSCVQTPQVDPDVIKPSLLFDKPFGLMDFDKQVLPVFRAWLHMTDDIETSIRIAYAVILSNQLRGEPLWVQIVAPPGGGKTEVLRATNSVANTYFLSSIKPAALVSGWAKGDPSVLPKLVNKTLVVKDLTTLISAPPNVKREVFGILRDAYDGEADYQYGQGVVRHYPDIWFSVLAGVTPAVFADPETSLGQRFLIYHSIKGAMFDDSEFVKRAAEGSRVQTQMREALSDITKEYLESKIVQDQIQEVPFKYRNKLVNLAMLTAKLRAAVERDKYKNDVILYPPQSEIATRLVQQFLRLGQFLAVLEPGMLFNNRVYSIIKRVAMDTCNPFNIQIASLLAKNHDGLSADQLVISTNLPHDTVMRRVDDMRRLGLLESLQAGAGSRFSSKFVYTLSDAVKGFWKQAGLQNGRTKVKFEELKPITVAKPRKIIWKAKKS